MNKSFARTIIAPGSETELLAPFRLTMIWVALTLGWVSAGVVLVGALSPSWHSTRVEHALVLALVASAATVNGALGLMPWRRWMGTARAEFVLAAWAAAVVVLISVFVHLGGSWADNWYLLYFLVVPFIAATEPLGRQTVLFVMAIVGYVVATITSLTATTGSELAIHSILLAGACVLSGFLAQALSQTTRDRARAEAAARMERLLADEAHHRIKNNLQLIGDLLSMEASKEGSQLATVVEETLSRIQSVAAVHQALATAGEGRVALRPVVDRIVGLASDRLAGNRSVQVTGGEGTEVAGRRATWTALVINELITNALRHGSGTVRVTIEGGAAAGPDGEVVLRVCDEGAGPGDSPQGLGLALVTRLVEDGLEGGIVSRCEEAGWEVKVVFPTGCNDLDEPATVPTATGRVGPTGLDNKELAGAGTDR
ncbi:MAG: sensor histidine kinase [Acidimicrobiales bacterium]